MTTLTREQEIINTQEAPIDELGISGIAIDGKGEDIDANN